MKIYAGFDEDVYKVLQGNFTAIAEKNSVTPKYVILISQNKREIKSDKSKAIYQDLLDLLDTLSPKQASLYKGKIFK